LPLVRWLGGAILLPGIMLALAISLRGTPWPALVLWLGVGTLAWGFRSLAWARPHAPRRLRLCADGSLCLFMPDGSLQPARLRPCSLRLGRQWLLVLQGRHRTWHLLFGPGNLSAAELAALARWLQQPAADPAQPGTARPGRYFG
jgi:hypothetical protein